MGISENRESVFHLFIRNTVCFRRLGRRRQGRRGWFYRTCAFNPARSLCRPRGAFSVVRGIKRNRSRPKWVPPIPWIRLTTFIAGELFPGEAVEPHMDNAMAHHHSEDFNPREKRREKAALRRRATGRTTIREVQESLRRAQQEEPVYFLRARQGSRVPEVFKVSDRRGGVVERTPIPPGAPTPRAHMGNERRICW